MNRIARLCLCSTLLFFVYLAGSLNSFSSTALATPNDSFYPTWKLMNSKEKQQFIAGYLYAWKDADKVTAIALDYVKSNPQKAIESLESIKNLYDLSDLTPSTLVHAIDSFYTEPVNAQASLSSAVSAARRAVQ